VDGGEVDEFVEIWIVDSFVETWWNKHFGLPIYPKR
jgi:hypothetical protein